MSDTAPLLTDRDLRQLTKHVMVDFNQMKAFSADPLIMVGGEGVYLIDHEGRRYIDGLSGVFAVSLGHGNEEIIEAVSSQLRTLAFSSPIMTTNDRALELAAELIRLTGGRYDVFKQFCNGSDATEAAMKMARQYHRQSGSPARFKTIAFYRSYHGATMGSLSATGWPQLRNPYEPLLHGVIHLQPPVPSLCRVCAGGPCSLACVDQLRDTIELEGERTISAVIVEPVMLTAGVEAPSREYFQALRALCDETGVLLIFDEIVTGFGRLGFWFGAEELDVWPDLLCVGKGLSSGYAPLSGVLLSPRVSSAFWGDSGDGLQFQAGHTFAGNPVSAAAGLAVIRYLEQHDVLDNVVKRGSELHARLAELVSRYSIAGPPRGRGLLYCVDFMADRDTGRSFSADMPVGAAVQRAARRRGLLVRASPHNTTIAPPLVVSSSEVAEIADTFEASVAEVADRIASGRTLDLDVAFGL